MMDKRGDRYLLLNASGPLHQLADELHEAGAQYGVFLDSLDSSRARGPASFGWFGVSGHLVVQLGEEREQHLASIILGGKSRTENLYPPYGVEGRVDRSGDYCGYVLHIVASKGLVMYYFRTNLEHEGVGAMEEITLVSFGSALPEGKLVQ